MARRRGVLATFVQIQREAERDRARRAQVAARAQRDALRIAQRANVQDQKVRDRLYAESRAQEAAEDTGQLDRQIDVLQSVLAATLGVDDYLDLESLKQPPPYPTFDQSSLGQPPVPPRESDFAVEAPSGMGRVFGGSKHTALAEQRQVEFHNALNNYNGAMHRYSQRVDEARRHHDGQMARLEEEHRQHIEAVTALQRGLAARQPEAVVRYLDLVLEAAEYPEGFPHSWRLAYAASSGHLDIEYELPQIQVVPTDKAYKYVKSSDVITPSARPATQIRTVYAEVLRQTALRVLHEVLEADRGGAIRTVVFNGYASGIDPATGREVRPCLVALATSRERFLEIDLAHVNTVACLQHLEALVSKDPSKLLAVEPIVLAGSLEADYTMATDEEFSTAAPESPVVSAPPSTNQQELVAGQNMPLGQPQVQVDLLTTAADLSVLLVGASGKVDRDEDFIFYNNPRSADGAVELTAQGVSIATDRLRQGCERVVVVISSGDGGSIADGTAVLTQLGEGSAFRFRPADSAGVSALVWGEVYLRNGGWRLRIVGQGWADGLAGLARDYGVNVD